MTNIVQIWLGDSDGDLRKIIDQEHRKGESMSETLKRLLSKTDNKRESRIEKKLDQILERLPNEDTPHD